MLIVLEGPMGSGKTVSLTILGHDALVRGRDVWSNYNLKFKHKLFNEDIFFELNDKNFELSNCIILGDEGYLLADKRLSMSKQNRVVNYYVVQTRKRHVDFAFATHTYDRLDERVKSAVGIRIKCKFQKGIPIIYVNKHTKTPLRDSQGRLIQAVHPETNELLWIEAPKLTWTINNIQQGIVDVKQFDPSPWFKYYDTEEIVPIPQHMVKSYAVR